MNTLTTDKSYINIEPQKSLNNDIGIKELTHEINSVYARTTLGDEKYDCKHSDLSIRLCEESVIKDEMDIMDFVDGCEKFIDAIFEMSAIIKGEVLEREKTVMIRDAGEIHSMNFSMIYGSSIINKRSPEELENEILSSIENEENEEREERKKGEPKTNLVINEWQEEQPQTFSYSYYDSTYNVAATALSYANPWNYLPVKAW